MEFILGIQRRSNICKPANAIHHTNKMKNKSPMISSIDAEKESDEIQHLFMMKPLSNVCIQTEVSNHIKILTLYITCIYIFIHMLRKQFCFGSFKKNTHEFLVQYSHCFAKNKMCMYVSVMKCEFYNFDGLYIWINEYIYTYIYTYIFTHTHTYNMVYRLHLGHRSCMGELTWF